MIAIMLSFAAGIWISVNQSRFTGLSGNIIGLHGLDFHALQAVPLVGWLTERASPSHPGRRRLVHLTGIAYLLGLAAIAWQTILGSPILEWTTLPFLACGCFLIALASGIMALSAATATLRMLQLTADLHSVSSVIMTVLPVRQAASAAAQPPVPLSSRNRVSYCHSLDMSFLSYPVLISNVSIGPTNSA